MRDLLLDNKHVVRLIFIIQQLIQLYVILMELLLHLNHKIYYLF